MEGKVFVTRKMLELDKIREMFPNCEVWEGDCPCPNEVLVEKAKYCEALITQLSDKIDESILSNPQLKVVAQVAVGVDNIDLAAATKHQVVVSHTPGILTEACADHAWALMMAAARNLIPSNKSIYEGKWTAYDPCGFLGNDFNGATMGIIGPGRIGLATARRSKGFNMRLLYHGPHQKPDFDELGAKYVSLEELLRESDYVVLTCPLNAQTRGLIGKEQLEMMKKTAVLVNIARGLVVKTDDLYDALKNHVIGKAALDVTDPEPLPKDHKLLFLDNCVVIPHIASATFRTRAAMSMISANAVANVFNGKPVEFCANKGVVPK